MVDSWRPNWRDRTTYPDYGDNLYPWGYEFLRRNVEYRKDYAKWDALPWFYEEGGHTPKEGYRSFGDFTPMTFLYADPPALPGETYGDYYSRTRNDDVIALETHLLNKWGLAIQLPNPSNTDNVWIWESADAERLPPYAIGDAYVGLHGFYAMVPQEHYADNGYYIEQAREEEKKLLRKAWGADADMYVHAFGIDLRYNIDEQLRTIRGILNDIKNEWGQGDFPGFREEIPIPKIKPSPGIHLRLLVAYLRVLDAIDANANDADIRDVIYAEEVIRRPPSHATPNDIKDWKDKANKWVKRAKLHAVELTTNGDNGYRNLFRHAAFKRAWLHEQIAVDDEDTE